METGTYNWEVSDLGSTGDYYARSSSWNGSSADTSVIWLISPGMDLSSANSPILTFKSACNYTGYDMEVLISTDYDGLIAPASASWTDISSSTQLSTGGFTWTNSGNVDLSAFNGQDSVYLAFKYIGGPAIGAKTWEVDNILVDESGTAPPSTVSIYNIQYTTDPSGASPYADSIVSTGGIVTAADSAGYFLQSGLGPWTGIYVYETNNNVARGDSVTLTAQVDEFFNFTELINPSNVNIVASGNTLPATTVTVSEVNEEMYEGVLVTLLDVPCMTDPNNFGEWVVGTASNSCTIGDRFHAFTPVCGVMDITYDITGPIEYSFSTFMVQPRDANDITVITGMEETPHSFSIFPNPSDGNFLISLFSAKQEEMKMKLVSIEGKTIYEYQANLSVGQNLFPVSNINAAPGYYLLDIYSGSDHWVQPLIIK